jgi:hypothetical protein
MVSRITSRDISRLLGLSFVGFRRDSIRPDFSDLRMRSMNQRLRLCLYTQQNQSCPMRAFASELNSSRVENSQAAAD